MKLQAVTLTQICLPPAPGEQHYDQHIKICHRSIWKRGLKLDGFADLDTQHLWLIDLDWFFHCFSEHYEFDPKILEVSDDFGEHPNSYKFPVEDSMLKNFLKATEF